MPEIVIPLNRRPGHIEVRDASGRCIIDGCKIKGGGLVRIQNVTSRAEQIDDLAWDGKAVVVCGDHLVEVLTAVLHVPDDA